jgi:hypothetical protein
MEDCEDDKFSLALLPSLERLRVAPRQPREGWVLAGQESLFQDRSTSNIRRHRIRRAKLTLAMTKKRWQPWLLLLIWVWRPFKKVRVHRGEGHLCFFVRPPSVSARSRGIVKAARHCESCGELLLEKLGHSSSLVATAGLSRCCNP